MTTFDTQLPVATIDSENLISAALWGKLLDIFSVRNLSQLPPENYTSFCRVAAQAATIKQSRGIG